MSTRTTVHIILGVILWVVFGYYWYLVVRQPVTEHTRLALSVVGSIVGLITLFLFFWVIHNIRIDRRHGRRKQRSQSSTAPPTDFLGRTFVAPDENAMKTAPYVEIHLIAGEQDEIRKVFHIAGGFSKG